MRCHGNPINALSNSVASQFLPFVIYFTLTCAQNFDVTSFSLSKQAVDETSLKLVKSFADVINDGDHPLNLQMFHRPPDGSSSRGGNGQDYQPPAAEVPVLPDLLEWPLPRFFAAGGEDSGSVM